LRAPGSYAAAKIPHLPKHRQNPSEEDDRGNAVICEYPQITLAQNVCPLRYYCIQQERRP